jgi:hypothetical protein
MLIDEFAKIFFKFSDLKRCHLGPVYIPKLSNQMHAGSTRPQFCTVQVTRVTAEYLLQPITTAMPLIFKIIWVYISMNTLSYI